MHSLVIYKNDNAKQVMKTSHIGLQDMEKNIPLCWFAYTVPELTIEASGRMNSPSVLQSWRYYDLQKPSTLEEKGPIGTIVAKTVIG